jgi:hypothetical protein
MQRIGDTKQTLDLPRRMTRRKRRRHRTQKGSRSLPPFLFTSDSLERSTTLDQDKLARRSELRWACRRTDPIIPLHQRRMGKKHRRRDPYLTELPSAVFCRKSCKAQMLVWKVQIPEPPLAGHSFLYHLAQELPLLSSLAQPEVSICLAVLFIQVRSRVTG